MLPSQHASSTMPLTLATIEPPWLSWRAAIAAGSSGKVPASTWSAKVDARSITSLKKTTAATRAGPREHKSRQQGGTDWAFH
jgi:hypothetical protein